MSGFRNCTAEFVGSIEVFGGLCVEIGIERDAVRDRIAEKEELFFCHNAVELITLFDKKKTKIDFFCYSSFARSTLYDEYAGNSTSKNYGAIHTNQSTHKSTQIGAGGGRMYASVRLRQRVVGRCRLYQR
jgi:hypothetical protein